MVERCSSLVSFLPERPNEPRFTVSLAIDSKPVAITVIFTSSFISLSNAIPQMMFASGCAFFAIIAEADSTSSRLTSGEERIETITPFAPLIVVSISGLAVSYTHLDVYKRQS